MGNVSLLFFDVEILSGIGLVVPNVSIEIHSCLRSEAGLRFKTNVKIDNIGRS